MRILFLSDIHGVPSTLEQALAAAEPLNYDKIVLLGDLLYHGPRNGVPNFYDPVKVVEILNSLKEKIVAVRGNCEADVDQMVLPFPVLAEYAVIFLGEQTVYITHGHKDPPPLQNGDILLCGHTHIPADEMRGGYRYLNPGSVSIPKNSSGHSYMIMDDAGRIEWKELR